MLDAWDGTMAASRPEPLVLTAWWRELARALYADELGDAFRDTWGLRPAFLRQVFFEKRVEWRGDFADEAAPFASRHAASYRAFSEPWARGEYVPMVTDRRRLEAEGAQRLVLTPRR